MLTKFNKLFELIFSDKIDINDLIETASKIKEDKVVPLQASGNSIDWISYFDIFYLHQVDSRNVQIATNSGIYNHDNRKFDLIGFLSNVDCYKFLDKRLLVNCTQIKCYDSYMGLVYFTDDIENATHLKARVKLASIPQIEKIIGKSKDITEYKEIEYFPRRNKVFKLL